MADFCKQCANEHFPPGYDKDLAFRYWEEYKNDPVDHLSMNVICEGCGPTIVNSFGICQTNCLLNHNEDLLCVD